MKNLKEYKNAEFYGDSKFVELSSKNVEKII